MPETVTFSPAGAVVTEVPGVAGPGVLGIVRDAVGLFDDTLGMGAMEGKALRETWCLPKRKMATGRHITPITKSATRIQRSCPRAGVAALGPENGPL